MNDYEFGYFDIFLVFQKLLVSYPWKLVAVKSFCVTCLQANLLKGNR